MRMAKTIGVICWTLLIGWANTAVAADGDIYGSGSSFSSPKSTKAKMSPALRAQLSIPPEIVEGVEFQLECIVEALKNQKGAPQKGVKGSLALFAISLDISSRTWEFFGLRDSGISFKTKAKGTSLIKSGTITAGPWANNPSDNDTILASVLFNNTKKIKGTSLYCEVIVGE
jgi:2-keto-4-pentenoate hydratase/2-oxohepta-3-ene-1,7-dioic acid hydratase in catechol pathway